ncbi:nuclear transport factor 2 family protein [Xanthovirga aplysinae]|uniref:nuclear transport factor 2 family protein n=1 Tax=Xanthovirga aplysinae TaxID=2529853 RepID=UPI0012BD7B35|nr:nuclear transport factor 2 family protein [Xanthovirga aplysinae]MTI32838.1 nuclear transport factor 2 family protein [Xanthovirga aplysinae]
MDNKKKNEIFHQVLNDLEKGDIPHLLDNLTPDINWHEPSTSIAIAEVRSTGRLKGKEQVKNFLQRLERVFTVDHFTINEDKTIMQDDKAAFFGRADYHSPTTGQKGSHEWAVECTFKNNKINDWHVYRDAVPERRMRK